jgi:uncharacterized membrane protein YeaQ/YmgE (transglycosylase-associated protein family)
MHRVRGYALGVPLCVAGLPQGQEVTAKPPSPGATELQPGGQIFDSAVRLNDGSGYGILEVIFELGVVRSRHWVDRPLARPRPAAAGPVADYPARGVGAFLGGLLYWALNRSPGEPFSFSTNAWHGWISSIIGAVIVLLVFRWWQSRRTTW